MAAIVCALVAAIPAPASAAQTGRLSGGTRFETAVAISKESFPNGAQHVFLARSDAFADALAAGSLRTGPVLLVPSCGDVPSAVTAEVSRLNPATVFALGGTTAVCDAVLTAAAGGRTKSRLVGGSRFETAVEISKFAFPGTAPEVYLANAADSPDAVAGGVLTQGPILLVPSTGQIPGAVMSEISRLLPQRVVALGGTSAVSDAVLAQAAAGRQSARLAGGTRFETAVAIAKYQFPAQAADVFLARADVFSDAVAGGSLRTGPILLVPQCGTIPAAVSSEISRLAPGRIIALGGETAVCASVLAAAAGGGGGGGGGTLPGDLVGRWVQENFAGGDQKTVRIYVFRADGTYDYSNKLCSVSTQACSGPSESGTASASGGTLSLTPKTGGTGEGPRSYPYSVGTDAIGAKVLRFHTAATLGYDDVFYFG